MSQYIIFSSSYFFLSQFFAFIDYTNDEKGNSFDVEIDVKIITFHTGILDNDFGLIHWLLSDKRLDDENFKFIMGK